MKANYLLKEIKSTKELVISEHLLHDISDFKTGKELSSMEGVAFLLSGHQPIRIYSFDISVFEDWCNKNNFIFYFSEKKREYHIKNK